MLLFWLDNNPAKVNNHKTELMQGRERVRCKLSPDSEDKNVKNEESQKGNYQWNPRYQPKSCWIGKIAAENKYRELLENLPQKIFHKDKNSVYVSCNNNFARDLKIQPDEIIGRQIMISLPRIWLKNTEQMIKELWSQVKRKI